MNFIKKMAAYGLAGFILTLMWLALYYVIMVALGFIRNLVVKLVVKKNKERYIVNPWTWGIPWKY